MAKVSVAESRQEVRKMDHASGEKEHNLHVCQDIKYRSYQEEEDRECTIQGIILTTKK